MLVKLEDGLGLRIPFAAVELAVSVTCELFIDFFI